MKIKIDPKMLDSNWEMDASFIPNVIATRFNVGQNVYFPIEGDLTLSWTFQRYGEATTPDMCISNWSIEKIIKTKDRITYFFLYHHNRDTPYFVEVDEDYVWATKEEAVAGVSSFFNDKKHNWVSSVPMRAEIYIINELKRAMGLGLTKAAAIDMIQNIIEGL